MRDVEPGRPQELDLAAPEADPMIGRVLAGRFTILSRVGAGSMGTVYRATQAPIGRAVAIKILRSDRAVDEMSRARFLREARANSALTSPNTVTVFDFGQSESGDFYLAMELLEGESLGERLRRLGRLSPVVALETARQALLSLSEAHAKGIIHRDLKPDNLFFARAHAGGKYDEVVKVLDFGIAKMIGGESELPMNAVETQAGTVFGTPRYMSPEQAQGKPLDVRSDIYSLGVILFHMMTGRAPFADEDAIVVMARHIKTPPPAMREVAPDADIAPAVERAVMRFLSKDPGKRPQTAEAMLAEVTRGLESAIAWRGSRPAAAALAGPGAVLAAAPGTATDTLESQAVDAWKPPGRLRNVALGLAALACAAVALAVVTSRTGSSGARGGGGALPAPGPVATDAPLLPLPTTAAAPAVPPEAPSPAPRPVAAAPSAPSATTPVRADPRPLAPPRRSPAVSPKTAGKAPVGYGYLE